MNHTPFSYKKICFDLFFETPPRTKDILAKRFGLVDAKPATLEAIGKEHSITRERVRQIVEDGIQAIRDRIRQDRKSNPVVPQVFSYFAEVLKQEGYLKREDLLVRAIGSPEESSHITFLLLLDDRFAHSRETEEFHPFWAAKKEYVDAAPDIHQAVLSHLEGARNVLSQDELRKDVFQAIPRPRSFTADSLFALLESSKHILRSYDGKWGLRAWPEVNPKGVREKAYIVLKNGNQPFHFTEIASRIQELQQFLPEHQEKKILPQTVHNELIKDDRFVLVGRGVYALTEWGYKEGTVKEVMISILQESESPLSREELIQRTLQQRQVRESTILLNLQDKLTFLRTGEGNYILKA